MTVEAMPSTQEGLTTYRFYINMLDATDRMSAVYGNNEASLEVNAPAGVFNSTFNASWNASGINPAFVPVFPELVDDTYATIGLDGPAASSGLADAADPSVVEDNNQPITPFFLDVNATTLLSNTVTGSSWYILNTASNGLPDADLRVLMMQVTTAGNVSGQMNVQVFPLGDGGAAQLLSWTFDGAGQYGGSVDDVLGCTAEMACNFNPEATLDDGSCDFTSCINFGCTDEDACNYDMDAAFDDGSCEYANFPYDCDNQCVNDTDADGVCDELEVAGCTDESACNFNELATDDGGNCVFPEPRYNATARVSTTQTETAFVTNKRCLGAPTPQRATTMLWPQTTTDRASTRAVRRRDAPTPRLATTTPMPPLTMVRAISVPAPRSPRSTP